VPVQLGISVGTWISVRADLKPGDRVVTLGNERLLPGGTVTILRELPPSTEPGERAAAAR
jgi:multidrug efflux pump subunit AcrA (membrane-fusion protein)